MEGSAELKYSPLNEDIKSSPIGGSAVNYWVNRRRLVERRSKPGEKINQLIIAIMLYKRIMEMMMIPRKGLSAFFIGKRLLVSVIEYQIGKETNL
jgi:hypothetical protein